MLVSNFEPHQEAFTWVRATFLSPIRMDAWRVHGQRQRQRASGDQQILHARRNDTILTPRKAFELQHFTNIGCASCFHHLWSRGPFQKPWKHRGTTHSNHRSKASSVPRCPNRYDCSKSNSASTLMTHMLRSQHPAPPYACCRRRCAIQRPGPTSGH